MNKSNSCISAVSKDFKVSYNDYGGKLVDHNAVILNAVANVQETHKMFADDYEFRLENKEDAVDIKVESFLFATFSLLLRFNSNS